MDDSDIRPASVHRSLRWVWNGVGIALAAIFLLFSISSNVMEAVTVFAKPEEVGDLGAKFQRSVVDGRTELTLTDVETGSPVTDAGFRAGDKVALDHPWDDLRTLPAGERLGLTSTAGNRVEVVIPVTEQLPLSGRLALNLNLLANIPLLLVSIFMLWRSRGDRAILALGMAFACMGAASPYRWPTGADTYPVWHVVLNAGFALIPWLLLHFTMEYCGRHNARTVSGRARRIFWPLVSVAMSFYVLETLGTLQLVPIPVLKSAALIDTLMQASGFILSFYYLRKGMKRERIEEQKRYILLMMALVGAFFPNIVFIVTSHIITPFRFGEQPWLSTMSWMFQISGAFLFAYAIFKHKILDLGFAINRTMVYAVVSVILLASFGFGEWAAGQIIDIESRQQSLAVDAGIAFALFLAFDRVRDFVEHYIEALFFRDWQNNEKRLRLFIKEARFFAQRESLNEAFVKQLSQFCGGADCALYREDEQGGYVLTQSNGNEALPVIGVDHPAVVSLRAHHKPLDLDRGLALNGAVLAFPMLHRNNLQGFALIGAKPSGGGYRPDEIELMGTAVQQVGLDLFALNLDALQEEAAQLRNANLLLERKYAELVAGLRTIPA